MLTIFPEPSSIKLIIKFITCIRENEIFHLKSYWYCFKSLSIARTNSQQISYPYSSLVIEPTNTKCWLHFCFLCFAHIGLDASYISHVKARGGGGTPLYQVYRYVPHQRVWFLSRFGLKTGIDFEHFGLILGMVIGGTFTKAYFSSQRPGRVAGESEREIDKIGHSS